MAIEDCYFFLTTGCTKGPACTFRHSATAKNTLEMCSEYVASGKCSQLDCGKRHSTFHLPTDEQKEWCYFERVKGACTKDTCPFRHRKKDNGLGRLNADANEYVPKKRQEQDADEYSTWKSDLEKLKSQVHVFKDSLDGRFAALESTFAEVEALENEL